LMFEIISYYNSKSPVNKVKVTQIFYPLVHNQLIWENFIDIFAFI